MAGLVMIWILGVSADFFSTDYYIIDTTLIWRRTRDDVMILDVREDILSSQLDQNTPTQERVR